MIRGKAKARESTEEIVKGGSKTEQKNRIMRINKPMKVNFKNLCYLDLSSSRERFTHAMLQG